MNGQPHESPGGIALIGSGELADAMAETHRTIMAQLRQPVRPVFVDTLAGFEPNVDEIDRKACSYFQRNFGLELAVAAYRSGRESPDAVAAAIGAIEHANYILAGPGSPSYGIRVLRSSPVWQAIVARWREGAVVVLASAAAIVAGARAIPVYEIFKAGHDIAWIAGLDLLGQLGLSVAIVPHWNTQSGGDFDARFCYMGAARFEQLERRLPPDDLILGIDEHTGIFIQPDRRAEVLGAGSVTLRNRGRQAVYTRGDRFVVGDLDRSEPAVREVAAPPFPTLPVTGETGGDDILALRAAVAEALAHDDIQSAVEGLVALSLIAGAGIEQSLPNRTELAVQTLQAMLPKLSRLTDILRMSEAVHEERRALVDLLVTARSALRQARQWSMADAVRDRLVAMGYSLSDTDAGTTWSRADAAMNR